LHFTDHHSIKSGGAGQGQGHICLPRPSATASLSGRRQKLVNYCQVSTICCLIACCSVFSHFGSTPKESRNASFFVLSVVVECKVHPCPIRRRQRQRPTDMSDVVSWTRVAVSESIIWCSFDILSSILAAI
jgi:hypothetical protein